MTQIKTGLYQPINESYFHDRFIEMNRKENFSYEGRKALFEHLEALSEDMQQPIELDVIALCCEYSEYKDEAEAYKQDALLFKNCADKLREL